MKRYPKYKESGVEWIGEIPSHWEVKRIQNVAEIDNSGIWGEDEPFEGCIQKPISTTAQLTIDGVWIYDEMNIRNLTKKEWDTYKCIEGDIVVVKSSGSATNIITGKCGYINKEDDQKFSFSNFLLRVRPTSINSKLVYYFLSSNITKQRIERMVSSTTYPNLKTEEYVKSQLFLPSLQEQQSIANYLDNKTHQIDTLIDKKQKQIVLLKEQRTAIINHAVTKGLNSDVKLKDSGIEWLGEIPEHWKIIRLKYLSSIKYGLGQPPRQIEGGLPLIRATNIERGKINERDLILVDPEDIPYERDPVLKTNDIIVVRSGAYTADSAIIPKKFNGSITGYDLVVRAQKINPKLLAFILLSNYVLFNQLYLHRLRAAQPHLNAEELGKTLILSPLTSQEQKGIVSFLESENTKIDNTIQQSIEQIELLKEYRTTLISDAVTGKIDLRDEVPQ